MHLSESRYHEPRQRGHTVAWTQAGGGPAALAHALCSLSF